MSVGEVDTMWREQQSAQVVCAEEESSTNEELAAFADYVLPDSFLQNEMSDEKADVIRLDQVEEQETSAGVVVEDIESRHASVHVNIAQGKRRR